MRFQQLYQGKVSVNLSRIVLGNIYHKKCAIQILMNISVYANPRTLAQSVFLIQKISPGQKYMNTFPSLFFLFVLNHLSRLFFLSFIIFRTPHIGKQKFENSKLNLPNFSLVKITLSRVLCDGQSLYLGLYLCGSYLLNNSNRNLFIA